MKDKDPDFNLALAQHVGGEIVALLSPTCKQIVIAGSIRRGSPRPHDVDIVIEPLMQPRLGNQLALFSVEPELYPDELLSILEDAGLYRAPAAPGYPRIIRFPYGPLGIPIELYLSDPDGGNFGALLQMRTGSAEFNVSLASRALKMGLRYSAGYGVFHHHERMDNGTEDGIFAALGLPCIAPEQRKTHYMQSMMENK